MFDATPEMIQMYTILVLGMAAVALGLPGLFRRRRGQTRSPWRPALALALVLALMGATAALTGLPRYVWVPPLALAPIWLLFGLLRTGWPTSVGLFLVHCLAQPRAQAAMVMVAGGSLLTWQTYALTVDVENQFSQTDALLLIIKSAPPLEENPVVNLYTDAGQRIALWRAVANFTTEEFEAELDFLHDRGFDNKLIRTAPPDITHNCHGWVFTGGKGWIRGAQVDQILKENRYQVVSNPAPGDVAIYRDTIGLVSHTALVRSISDDGTVLLESKWGKLGRFIHTASEHVYSLDSCTFYHSPRGSHLMRLSKSL